MGFINPKAIATFLDRPRTNWSWYKRLTDEKLEARRSNLKVDPPIWEGLHRHQKAGFLLAVRLKRLCLWYDTGTGKSIISIALIRYFKKKGSLKRALILVPNKVNKNEWEQELTKHSPGPELSFCLLSGSSANKWDTLTTTDATVIIETYAGFVRMLSSLQQARKKQHLKPDRERVKEVAGLIDTMILDESGAVGNHQSLAYRICRKLSKTCQRVYALNGTPIGRDPTPLWAQMHVVDQGETLGETLGLFRATFFTESQNYWGATEYTFRENKSKLLNRLITNRSLRYTADESDLPAVTPIVKTFALGRDANEYYDKALQSLRQARGNVTELKNEFLRMRQLSSGFLGYKDDETGMSAQLEFTPNPKLEMLLSLLQEIVGSYKAVVFHDFTFSGSIISRELRELKIGHARIFGGTKDAGAELSKFNTDDECRVLVLNNHAGGMGLNLQVARYGIYYESPVSAIMRKQTRARVVRQGSKFHKVLIYDLVMRQGVDEKILEFHKQGADLLKAIIDGSASL